MRIHEYRATEARRKTGARRERAKLFFGGASRAIRYADHPCRISL
jgi:hypothetical protein